jgi:hypothetical protein
MANHALANTETLEIYLKSGLNLIFSAFAKPQILGHQLFKNSFLKL